MIQAERVWLVSKYPSNGIPYSSPPIPIPLSSLCRREIRPPGDRTSG